MNAKGHPLAFCPVHGLFESSMISMNMGGSFSYGGVSCDYPGCSLLCEIIPGQYLREGREWALLLHESVSPEALRALTELARQVQAGEVTPEEAQQEAEKITPKAKGLFDFSGMSDGPRAAVIAALIGGAAALGASGISGRATIKAAEINALATIEAAHITAKSSLLNSTAQTPVVQTPPSPRLKPPAPPKKPQ